MEWVNFGKWYRISKCGIVESCYSGQWKVMKRKKSKTDKFGGFYITVSIGKNHSRVHLLMWETWKGPRTKGKVINHKDGDRENCALDNLEEITQKANVQNIIDRGNFKIFGRLYDPRTNETERRNIKPILPVVGEEHPSKNPSHVLRTGLEHLDSCELLSS